MSIRSLLLSLTAILSAATTAVADDRPEQLILHLTTSSHAAATSLPHATAPPAAALHGYAYVGCWNETVGFRRNGGARALAGGKFCENDDMTTPSCLEFCSEGVDGRAMQYAGLEFGRECWCSASLSALSEKLNESSRCILTCTGNSSETCGGKFALALYNLTSVDFKTGVGWSQFSGVAGYGTLALVTLILAAVM